MSRRRLILVGIATAAAVGGVVPAFAQSSPVTVTRTQDGGVVVGSHLGNQPLVGASVDNGTACVGFSLEVPQCASVPPAETALQLPVTVTPNSDGSVTVGVKSGNAPVAGATVGPKGACAGIGEQVPVCVGGGASRTNRIANPLPPVTLRHDSNGTAVGVGDVGVVISPSGRICPVVSTQDWQCIGGDN